MKNNIYVGNRYVPVFADPVEWNNLRSYEPLTIVTYQGTSYTSKKTVPVGVELNNNEYWVATGNYNAQVENYRQEVNAFKDEVEPKIQNLTKNGTLDVENISDGTSSLVDDLSAIASSSQYIQIGDAVNMGVEISLDLSVYDDFVFVPRVTIDNVQICVPIIAPSIFLKYGSRVLRSGYQMSTGKSLGVDLITKTPTNNNTTVRFRLYSIDGADVVSTGSNGNLVVYGRKKFIRGYL